MLKLKEISKIYKTGELTQQALDSVSVEFRKSEFVAVLGPSGCGKTTLLNIIGGLDQYTSGDLEINGISTKAYKDRDWDTYRNHSVGFVFQSYNLIPHQSVLQNVELALSLSGVGKSERRKRAKQALEEVGLADQLHKKPSQMSGGQMQRVAIARAIVNDPDIVLADEPTGALDSETSLQVMEMLKELSKKRLVIMVTHNPELAEKYATRIVRILDGRITDDSNPLSAEETAAEEERAQEIKRERLAQKKKKKVKKPSMKFRTSFGLSLKNLITKKGRTTLTAFAGSIGIIGIALIYAVSNGMTTYIDTVQEETLSSYPLTLQAQHTDIGSMMEVFMESAESSGNHEKDAVYQKSALYDLVNALNSMETKQNDLASFKVWIEDKWANDTAEDGLHDAISGIQYTYNTDLLVYTLNADGTVILSDTEELMNDMMLKFFGAVMGTDREETENAFSGSLGMMDMMSQNGMGTPRLRLWQEILSGRDGQVISPVVQSQYEIIDEGGRWPQAYNEIVIKVDKNNEIDDMTLYALGLKSEAEMDAVIDAAISGETLTAESKKWTYDEIKALDYRVVLGSDCYIFDEATGLYMDRRATQTGLKYLYDNGIPLKVVGIIRPKEDAVATMITGSIGYTNLLTDYIVEKAESSPVVEAQKNSPNIDIFNGLPFNESTGNISAAEKKEYYKNYISEISPAEKIAMYIKMKSIPAKADVDAYVSGVMSTMDRPAKEAMMLPVMVANLGGKEEDAKTYLAEMKAEDLDKIITEMLSIQYAMSHAASTAEALSALPEAQLLGLLEQEMATLSDEQGEIYYDNTLTFSKATYNSNLAELGWVDMNVPSSINLYAASFAQKDLIKEAIDKYNSTKDSVEQIAYTDLVGVIMSSVTTIINAITYVLIAFVAVSLIVSSIMIGVITLISVQERTKEIGILRAIGASKRNVANMFNAETVIIGFASGLLGVGVTYLLCIPINLILHALTGIGNLSASLPLPVALILIGISVVLTLISGIIPSRSASKKDPVVALRTE